MEHNKLYLDNNIALLMVNNGRDLSSVRMNTSNQVIYLSRTLFSSVKWS